jgi:transcriptional regulator with XRE-family HTH domain
MVVDRIKDAQRKGWVVVAVDKSEIILRCPSHGCGLKAKFPAGKRIPSVDPCASRNPVDIPVGSYPDIQRELKERREELCLSISEVEEAAGLAHGHIGKAEKENPDRTPQIGTLLLWMQALGYELVLRRSDLTPYTARLIEGSRERAASRRLQHGRRVRPSRREQGSNGQA